VPDDARRDAEPAGGAPDAGREWLALEAALEAFRRVARKAVDVAGDPRATRAQRDEARLHATFGLASIGAQLKRALHAAQGLPEGPSTGSTRAPERG
jgi:hypothetical protein